MSFLRDRGQVSLYGLCVHHDKIFAQVLQKGPTYPSSRNECYKRGDNIARPEARRAFKWEYHINQKKQKWKGNHGRRTAAAESLLKSVRRGVMSRARIVKDEYCSSATATHGCGRTKYRGKCCTEVLCALGRYRGRNVVIISSEGTIISAQTRRIPSGIELTICPSARGYWQR